MYTIQLIEKENIEIILPFLEILNEKTDKEELRNRLREMCGNNYECVGVYDGEKLIGITGLWILTKHYIGKHIEPDNVIILPEYRNQKIGEQLMQWIFDYAKQKGCVASELNCYVQNHKGVRFWINQGYRIIGYHMQKIL
ncbi:MAG: GNAT family N-acetyltransferase [Flavipsychrobacter sp.]|nr:GNAT family N-acetyltransferase [Flavipsychrobacter sp.]